MNVNQKTNIIAVFLMVVIVAGAVGFILLPDAKVETLASVIGIALTALVGTNFYTGKGGNGNE